MVDKFSDNDIDDLPDYDPNAPGTRLCSAIVAGDAQEVIKILEEHPEELNDRPGSAPSWLHYAAREGQAAIVDVFLAAGMDVNKASLASGDTALNYAVGYGRLDVAKRLLSLGSHPSANRMLIEAINAKRNSFELVKLLVKHGAEVNEWWRFGDEETGPIFNALSWAIDNGRQDIADYLRAHGAVMPPEEPVRPPSNAVEEIVAYFEHQFGPVDRQALREIIPSNERSVVIHRITPSESRHSIILFTTGMSDMPMNAPNDAEEFSLAELLIELPADWPLSKKALADLNHRWPIDWLRKVAAYPHEENTWLGGPIAVMANNGNPPEPFSPNCRFSSMLLLTGYQDLGPISLSDGRVIQVYTLIPIYEDERSLEIAQGLPELFRRLDEFGVDRIVDPRRLSVASANRPD